jgi:hypothetical protein
VPGHGDPIQDEEHAADDRRSDASGRVADLATRPWGFLLPRGGPPRSDRSWRTCRSQDETGSLD